MKIAYFRSLWGLIEQYRQNQEEKLNLADHDSQSKNLFIESQNEKFSDHPISINWHQLLFDLKSKGFYGVEASLNDIQYCDQSKSHIKFIQSLEKLDMYWICGLYTSWDDYEGDWEDKSIQEHIMQFHQQLLKVNSILVPIAENDSPQTDEHQNDHRQCTRKRNRIPLRINVHAGSDDFTLDQSIEFFEKALHFFHHSSELNSMRDHHIPLSFETHRGRILHSPWITKQLLPKFPNLKLTLDLSHWIVVSERMLNTKKDWDFLVNWVVPRTLHIHARLGHAQAPQLDASLVSKTDIFKKEVDYFRKVWKLVFEYQKQSCFNQFTVTPEYGPEPYKPYSLIHKTSLDETIDQEKESLNTLFI